MKKRMLFPLIAAAILLLGGLPGYGQEKQPLAGATPDSKMIGASGSDNSGLSGLYSPNLFDGSANINIPIYQYNTDAGPMGISLSTNTKGVKVDEVASNVGLHVSLNAEFSIQRIVRGLPDELSHIYWDTVWTTGVEKYNKFRGRLAGSFDNSTDANDPMIFRDGESDDFVVSAGGLNFTFNIGTGRAIYTNPNRNYTVAIQSSGQDYATVVQQTGAIPDPRTLEFLITDLQGNQYHFKRGDYTTTALYADMSGNTNQGDLGLYNYISKWVADYVLLANGQQINYDYYSNENNPSPIAAYKAYAAKTAGTPEPPGGSIVRQGQYVSLIKSIQYPNGVTARFVYDTTNGRCDYGYDYSPSSMALREIRIQSGNNATRYQMVQSYTVVKTGNNTTIGEIPYGSPCVSINDVQPNRSHRLRLKGINMLSADNSISEVLYTFQYDPMELPLRFSGSQDYFGYYNGKTPVPYSNMPADADLSIPYHTTGSTSFGVDRSADFNKMRAGVLTDISNGYGGTLSFKYEPHVTTSPPITTPTSDYFKGGGQDDGLRLLRVIESAQYHQGNFRNTTFTYFDGIRFMDGGYFHYPLDINDANNIASGSGILTGNFMTPHHLVAGSNHGYSRVVMTISNENSQMLSKKEIRFTNISDSLSGYVARYTRVGGGKHFYEFPYTDKQYLREYEMGLPIEVKEYDQYGNILQRTVNEYRFTIDSTTAVIKQVQGLKATYVKDWSLPSYNGNSAGAIFIAPKRAVTDPYKPFTGEAQLKRTVSYKYQSDNSFVTDEVRYEYDDYKNLKATTTFNSSGEETKMINFYNYDLATVFNIGGTPIAFSPLDGQQRLVGSQRWKRLPNTTGDLRQNGVLLDAYFTGYGVPGSANPAAKVWTRNSYQFRSLDPITYSQYVGSGTYNNDGKKAWGVFNSKDDIPYFNRGSEVSQFDAKGNPQESYLPESDLYKVMLWDAVTGQKLAEAVNCRFNEIACSGFESSTKGNWNYNAADLSTGNGLNGSTALKALNTNTSPISASGLTTGKEYTLTFWCKGGTPALSGGGLGSIPLSILHSPGNGWTFYQARFTPVNTAAVGLAQTGSPASPFTYYIDDIRLSPTSAALQSWTYAPLWGISSQTDATGRISFSEYDALGRQTLTRDEDGHILSKTQYTVQGGQ